MQSMSMSIGFLPGFTHPNCPRRYFGGSLDFISLDGWGSDVFVKLRSLDDAEDIEIGGQSYQAANA